MGGCNQDMATYAMKRVSKDRETFRKIPIFLSTGESDDISTPGQTEDVVKSLRKSGFENIKFQTYPGAHNLNRGHVPIALDWFSELDQR